MMRVVLSLGAILTLVLAGCASPRYQTVNEHIPPADPAGRACLEQCAGKLTACQGDCKARYQQCREEAGVRARAEFPAVMQAYQSVLAQYRNDLLFYNVNAWMDRGMVWGYPGAWGWGWGMGWGYVAPPPEPPPVPTVEGETERLVRESCDQDCGCQAAYDLCFTSCGGRVVPRQQCIANCPPGERAPAAAGK
ncbi:MAG: hypothetical protein PHI49_12130 [Halothiobacillaceae bacterium]|nr:hypothetical protein [Halothiobacillaceae bacterium]